MIYYFRTMKDFLDYLKWKPTWIGIIVGSVFYFLLAQAYVYPTFTFDFSVIYKWSTWVQNAFFQLWMTITFYFIFWKPNPKLREKVNPQKSEGSK
ncbi:hypothetical protein SAMN03080617_04264 [Algoriphagus alkaliphilus]|uniref:Uncharacterized protein n=1 Tax=Algoriphagus alkaliphilus TaxID=279824 RepID=A0A1G5ZPA5_9BACT|nr:hypothetical protein SAMN03080617_04264 [Algoriphagus alkaliphilus]